jgi:hypothetical protein
MTAIRKRVLEGIGLVDPVGLVGNNLSADMSRRPISQETSIHVAWITPDGLECR